MESSTTLSVEAQGTWRKVLSNVVFGPNGQDIILSGTPVDAVALALLQDILHSEQPFGWRIVQDENVESFDAVLDEMHRQPCDSRELTLAPIGIRTGSVTRFGLEEFYARKAGCIPVKGGVISAVKPLVDTKGMLRVDGVSISKSPVSVKPLQLKPPASTKWWRKALSKDGLWWFNNVASVPRSIATYVKAVLMIAMAIGAIIGIIWLGLPGFFHWIWAFLHSILTKRP